MPDAAAAAIAFEDPRLDHSWNVVKDDCGCDSMTTGPALHKQCDIHGSESMWPGRSQGKVPVMAGRSTRHVGKADGIVLVIAHQKTEDASLHMAAASL